MFPVQCGARANVVDRMPHSRTGSEPAPGTRRATRVRAPTSARSDRDATRLVHCANAMRQAGLNGRPGRGGPLF